MGQNSTAKLPVFGKVDTDNEICLNTLATAYDALNKIMITRQKGVYDETTADEINGRFNVLRLLCNRYAPEKKEFLNKVQQIVLKIYRGQISEMQAIAEIRNVCMQYGVNTGILDYAALRIDQTEQQSQFVQIFPHWMQPQVGIKKRKRK